jgi:antiviral helicase SKI2
VKLVDTYRKWTKLLEKMSQNQCNGCIKLADHLKLAKEIKAHKEEVCALQFQMSDEALQQMPDFQGRVYHINIISCACK